MTRKSSIFIALISISIASLHQAATALNLSNHDQHLDNVFKPTREWQQVTDDMIIPSGLSYKIDFETGKKFAKLLDAEIDNEANKYSVVTVPNQADEEISSSRTHDHKIIKQENDHHSFKPDPSTSEMDDFTSSLAQLYVIAENGTNEGNHSSTNKIIHNKLDSLEELCHDIDFGVRLAGAYDFGKENVSTDAREIGLFIIAKYLNPNWDSSIRSKAAIVIGTAVQNNPKARQVALDSGLLKEILLRIQDITKEYNGDKENHLVLSRLLYTLSSMLRGSIDAARRFRLKFDGLNILGKVYDAEDTLAMKKELSGDIRWKCATLISDNYADLGMQSPENFAIKIQGKNNGIESDYVILNEEMRSWSLRFQKSLMFTKTSKDTLEKLLFAISNIKKVYLETISMPEFKEWLDKQSMEKGDSDDEYKRLVHEVYQQFI